MDEFFAALVKLAPIEWFRISPSKSQIHRLSFPPLMVWRFDSSLVSQQHIEEVERRLFKAIAEFQGHNEWVISKPSRNLVLTTYKVNELLEKGKYRTDAEVLHTLAKSDPSHGYKSHEDLLHLSQLIGGEK